jgi:hypothetical protein
MVRGGTPRGARAADAVGDTAEVVFLGELTGATGFKDTTRGSVLCKYVVVHGEHWHLDKGSVSGATQAAATSGFGGELAPWGHPFQLAFNTTSVQVRGHVMTHVDGGGRVPSLPSFSRQQWTNRDILDHDS